MSCFGNADSEWAPRTVASGVAYGMIGGILDGRRELARFQQRIRE